MMSAAEISMSRALVAVFWPHAETSQSAATPARREAPITQPKKRGPAIGIKRLGRQSSCFR
jgi:hypothetical protein